MSRSQTVGKPAICAAVPAREYFVDKRKKIWKYIAMIRFEEITNKNIWKVCSLEPSEHQKEFVALIRTFPFGAAEKVWLSYEPENTRAREIYKKYGFVESDEMCGNEIVAVYEL